MKVIPITFKCPYCDTDSREGIQLLGISKKTGYVVAVRECPCCQQLSTMYFSVVKLLTEYGNNTPELELAEAK